jgi:transposase-like protein
MDTTVEAVPTDKLGRRSGPRRKYTIAEKRAMVEETHRRGASVAEVAQRHQVNANLLFGWRRLYQRGVLNEESSSSQPALLPVKVSTPTLLPTERAARKAKPRSSKESGEGAIEIEFPSGQRLCIRGRVDHSTLMHVLTALSHR